MEAEEKAIKMIAFSAEGSLRDALSVLDQISGLPDGVSVKNVEFMLGGFNRQVLFGLADAIAGYDIKSTLAKMEEIKSAGGDMGILQKDLTGIMRDMFTAGFLNAVDGFAFFYDDLEGIKAMAEKMGRNAILRALEILIKCEQDMRYNSRPDIVLQTALIRVMTPEDDKTSGIARLDKIEAVLEQLKSEKPDKKPVIKDEPEKSYIKQAENKERKESSPIEKKERKESSPIENKERKESSLIEKKEQKESSPAEKKAPKEKKPLDENANELWKNILNNIQKNAAFIYEAARILKPEEITGTYIKLLCPEKYSSDSDLLSGGRAKQAIKKITSEVTGRELEFKIRIDKKKEEDSVQFTMENLGPGVEIL